jgi:hypothetical protein
MTITNCGPQFMDAGHLAPLIAKFTHRLSQEGDTEPSVRGADDAARLLSTSARSSVASAQPQPRKQKEDRPMSQAPRRARIARRDDPLDLDVTRQRREAPLRNDRHCMVESTPTLASHAEEPEIASNRGGHVPHVDARFV